MKISILGSGSWGTAMAKELSNRYDILLYTRNKTTMDYINSIHKNDKYLKEYYLPENIIATTDINEIVKSEIIINAIPTQKIREFLKENYNLFNENSIIINLSKGIENQTSYRISQIFKEFLPKNRYVALSGPSHAEEVIESVPTSLVAASEDYETAVKVQELLHSETLRIYTNRDLIGVEFGGALKNVLALGIGILDGVLNKDNTKAAIMTRGVHEMTRFCVHMGGDRNTLYGLAGIGDLIVTATSRHSRNRMAGQYIGEGHTISTLEKEIGMVVEGITTCKAIYEISQKENIYMPLTTIIYKLLFENLTVEEAAKTLMSSDGKNETEL